MNLENLRPRGHETSLGGGGESARAAPGRTTGCGKGGPHSNVEKGKKFSQGKQTAGEKAGKTM